MWRPLGLKISKVYDLRHPPPIGCSSCLTDHMGKKTRTRGRERKRERERLSLLCVCVSSNLGAETITHLTINSISIQRGMVDPTVDGWRPRESAFPQASLVVVALSSAAFLLFRYVKEY
ncbi:hypothetical protein BDV27DRAFT_126121 [Aspergillus caelatus]|uniref:Uncharacterized protein n=2 Tax=Aspergillus subgen. Circumdati TaxID=2720871 RepID=A0A5N7A9M5_9EURO|nr:uncharacterized protein BDV27DRAFT_126121 [Aspergillus caelatus]KAE8365846.1 hypothetical protein BDV27DRAFT_126121 [Aspergillus caelatus]KAE8417569.1 hypothetical protein BDV36DRAFT_256395 [Aspergillus pseudocaelatus]